MPNAGKRVTGAKRGKTYNWFQARDWSHDWLTFPSEGLKRRIELSCLKQFAQVKGFSCDAENRFMYFDKKCLLSVYRHYEVLWFLMCL